MTAQDSKQTPRPLGLMSIDTKTIYERILKASIGETVTYEELEKLIGRSVRERGTWLLLSARRRALNQDGLVFGTVAKIGIKRLSDTEIVAGSEDDVHRVHRQALRGMRKLTAIKHYDSLPAESKTRHGVNASALAVLAHMTRSTSLKRLETKVREQSQPSLPLQKTLEAFREK